MKNDAILEAPMGEPQQPSNNNNNRSRNSDINTTDNNDTDNNKKRKRWIVLLFSGVLGFGFYVSTCNYFFLKSITAGEILPTIKDQVIAASSAIINRSSSNTNGAVLQQLDLVVILSGELGNNLLKIAYGKIIQLFALEEGMFNFTLRFVSQGLSKSISARREVEQCFSKHLSPDKVNLAEWKLNSLDWKDIVNIQTTVIERFYEDEKDDPIQATAMLQITGLSFDSIRLNLEHLQDVIRRMNHQKELNETHYNDFYISNTDADGREITDVYKLSLPFVTANAFPLISLMDRYWDEISELFTFNEDRCCSVIPDVDETVLHIRGFNVEMPNVYNGLGFRELDPHQTSYELLSHLNPRDKVAIVSRFDEQSLANFTGALTERGLQVRFVSGLTGVQGFCFLKTASKELVGGNRSTYFLIAAMLNDRVKNVTIFCLNHNALACNTDHTITNKKLSRINWNLPIFHSERL